MVCCYAAMLLPGPPFAAKHYWAFTFRVKTFGVISRIKKNLDPVCWSDDEKSNDSVIDLIVSPNPGEKRKRENTGVQSVKLTKKPASQWVTSAFDGFADFADFSSSTQPSRSVQRKKTDSLNRTQAQTKKFFSVGNAGSNEENSKYFTKSLSTTSSGTNWLTGKKRPTYESDLWSDKYSPKSQRKREKMRKEEKRSVLQRSNKDHSMAELAVHKKKIADVEAWLQGHLNAKRKLPPMLILTGQAGTGKTATVKVLAKELRCDVQEWINPTGPVYQKSYNEYSKGTSQYDHVPVESQLMQFQQFLLRANKYNSLGIFGDHVASQKIILVEDFPNVFYRDASTFHDILRKYALVGKCPLVFIVSDSTSGESNERLLFPKDLQQELQIENISFNPIAQTSMTKVLNKIASTESAHGVHQFTIPSKVVLESIAMSSAGDVRGAINALQFACLRDTQDLLPSALTKGKALKKQSSKQGRSKFKPKSSSSEKGGEGEDLATIGARDTSLFLFRALGKILYCKRDDPVLHTDLPRLPPHLSEHERDPLLVNPEEVVEKSHLSGDYFSAYLHQNYLEFYLDISDLVQASEYLSDADHLTVDWVSRSTLQQYAASVATRGLIHCNTSRAKFNSGGSGLGWRPLHKPQWYTVRKQTQQNSDTARCLFKGYAWTPEVLQTEILPYISLINTTLNNPGQISFLQEICRYSRSKLPGRSEKLHEKDVDIGESESFESTSIAVTPSVESTDDFVSNSQSKVRSSQEEEVEEELIIDEYDD